VEDSNQGDPRTSLIDQTFYPLTLPLTTLPGTIAVVISLGLSHPTLMSGADQLIFTGASLAAIIVIAGAIFLSFAYADRVQSLLGRLSMNVAAVQQLRWTALSVTLV
jgi:multiple antibiotic resistance protein